MSDLGLVAYLLPSSLAHSTFASANVGVVVAFVVAGALYTVLSRNRAAE